jgi:hypothetical protein
MKMEVTHADMVQCVEAALVRIQRTDERPDDPKRYNTQLNFFEYLAEYAETVASEMVVARYFGVAYDPFESKYKKQADVGNAIEVKWTPYVTGQLIVHEYDRPTDIAVLVTGKAPHYFIAGWIPIAIARQAKYRHSRQPNWWVTQINLQPIENLRRSSHGNSAI